MTDKKALIIAPHPDDAEIFMGGTIAYLKSLNFHVTILDLTKGEMSSRGTFEERHKEKTLAAQVLGIDERLCADLPDGKIAVNDTQLLTIVGFLRKVKPSLLFAPYREDRHPDHLNTHKLIRDAVFMSNLKKLNDQQGGLPFIVSSVYWYMTRLEFKPSVLVDISAFKGIKDKSVLAYNSQVIPNPDSYEHQTLVGSSLSLHAIEARDAYYGSMAGVRYAEAFYHDSPIVVSNTSIFESNQFSNQRYIYPE